MKKIFFLTGFFIFSLISVNAQQDNTTETMDPQAAIHYNNAIQSMKAEKYEDALISLDSSLMTAKDYRSYFLQGQAYLKLNKIDNAKQSFSECLKLNPNYDMGWMASGNAHLAAKEYDQAENDFKKAAEVTKDPEVKKNAEESVNLTLNPKSIEFFNQGNEFYKQSKFEEAVKSFDQALSLLKDQRYYYQKGLALLKLNKNKEAEDAFKSAIAVNDSFDLAYVALASLQTANKDYEGALKSYEKALSITSNENLKGSIKDASLKTYLIAGNNAYKEKKYDQSIGWMMKLLAVSPSDEAYLGLAKSYIEKKKYNDAAAALDSAKAIKKTVTDGALAYYAGLIQLNKGEDSKAIESFTAALNDPVYKKASQAQIEYLKAKQKGTKPKK